MLFHGKTEEILRPHAFIILIAYGTVSSSRLNAERRIVLKKTFIQSEFMPEKDKCDILSLPRVHIL